MKTCFLWVLGDNDYQFQALLGTMKTTKEKAIEKYLAMFQALLGTMKTITIIPKRAKY